MNGAAEVRSRVAGWLNNSIERCAQRGRLVEVSGPLDTNGHRSIPGSLLRALIGAKGDAPAPHW